MNRELIIMVGIPGCGKSTKAINDANRLNQSIGLRVDPNFSEEAIVHAPTATMPVGPIIKSGEMKEVEEIGETEETKEMSDQTISPVQSGSDPKPEPQIPRVFICSADNFPGLYTRGHLNKSMLQDAHVWCIGSVRICMENDHQVILDNTNLNMDHWIPYLELAKEFGYTIRICVPSKKLLFYDVKGKDRSELQLAYLIQVRSKGSKIIPESTMRTFDKMFLNTLSVINTNKSSCGSDPHKWLTLCVSKSKSK